MGSKPLTLQQTSTEQHRYKITYPHSTILEHLEQNPSPHRSIPEHVTKPLTQQQPSSLHMKTNKTNNPTAGFQSMETKPLTQQQRSRAWERNHLPTSSNPEHENKTTYPTAALQSMGMKQNHYPKAVFQSMGTKPLTQQQHLEHGNKIIYPTAGFHSIGTKLLTTQEHSSAWNETSHPKTILYRTVQHGCKITYPHSSFLEHLEQNPLPHRSIPENVTKPLTQRQPSSLNMKTNKTNNPTAGFQSMGTKPLAQQQRSRAWERNHLPTSSNPEHGNTTTYPTEALQSMGMKPLTQQRRSRAWE